MKRRAVAETRTETKTKRLAKLAKKLAELAKCPIDGCWEMTPGGKMCSACRSWWGRVQLKTAKELEGYLLRLGRFAGRSVRLSHRRGSSSSSSRAA